MGGHVRIGAPDGGRSPCRRRPAHRAARRRSGRMSPTARRSPDLKPDGVQFALLAPGARRAAATGSAARFTETAAELGDHRRISPALAEARP